MKSTLPTRSSELTALCTALALVRQPVFILDAAGQQIVDANPAGCEAMSLARDELIGQPWLGFAGRLAALESREIEIQQRRYIIAVHEAAAAQQHDVATHDALTGLPNRQALLARFARDTADPAGSGLSLMFLDLDGFKQVNDTWGHVFGDRVLQIVAQRLLGSIRKSDLVVRYGGDEFIVVVEGVRRQHDLVRRARQITAALQTPMMIDGRELRLSASIGIARHQPHLTSVEALVAEADRAMYQAKAASRNKATAKLAATPVVAAAQRRRRPA